MKRACYCRNEDKTFRLKHVRSINRDGSIITESIPELSCDFNSLESLFMDANREGYGVIGELNDLKNRNHQKAYKEKCGNNQMDIDEL